MLSSMTGFGRASIDAPFGKIIVEIQSVNRKYLEVFISMPKELSRFEQEVRSQVGALVARGGVNVRIFLHPNVDAAAGLIPDSGLLKALKKAWGKIAHDLGTDPKEITLSFLMNHLPTFSKQDLAKDEDLIPLQEAVGSALSELIKMKKTEGSLLAQDLATRLNSLEKMVDEIQTHSPAATAKMRQRLLEKMGEVLKSSLETEERLLREVALFAERVDITEEITRFRSHLVQFRESLKIPVVGRKLDFLIQELGREVNTIGSKSMESKISHLVVDMKSELEKMREQIQNLE